MDVLMKENNIFYNVFCLLLSENEKLFDRNDAKLYWRTVFHMMALVHHCYVGLCAFGLDFSGQKDTRITDLKTFGPAFLTGWNFTFQGMFLALALCYDSALWADCGRSKPARLLRFWRDVVFTALVVPLTLFVSTMFWCVYTIDRELVFPSIFDSVIPWWINHSLHTWILAVVGLEAFLQPRSTPKVDRLNFRLCWLVSVLYAVVYYTTYNISGRWLYQVFGVMTWPQICVYQLCIWASIHCVYKIQWLVYHVIHKNTKLEELEESEDGESKNDADVFKHMDGHFNLVAGDHLATHD